MALASAMNMTGTDAAKPTSGFIAGRIYFATDTLILYYDNGTALVPYRATGSAVETIGADFKPTGLTGAVATTRYVGGTASGAPATGTFALGDFVIDQTGKVWVCTTAGTPGTWTQAGGGSAGLTSATNQLAADVSLSTANTYFDGPSLSLAAGTWLLTASLTLESTSTLFYQVKLWNGTTVAASIETANAFASGSVGVSLSALVSPGTTTTYKASVACSSTPGLIKAATVANGSGNNASTLVAVKIA
jgi:hypothetical protein